jgi:outer membrane protein TolC
MLAALADSETAANNYAAAQASVAHRDAALASATTRLALTRQRFAAGEDDRLAILEAVSAHAGAERLAIAARQQAALAYAALIKAIGG